MRSCSSSFFISPIRFSRSRLVRVASPSASLHWLNKSFLLIVVYGLIWLLVFLPFAFGKLFDSQLDVSAQLFRKAGKFQFLSLFGGVAKVLFSRNFCRIYRALRAAKPYPDLFVKSVRCIGKINRKYLAAFLVRQAEQILYLVELVLILPLVDKRFIVFCNRYC